MPTPIARQRPGAALWRDRLVAEDPGGFSRRAALRAFLSFLLSGGLMLAVGVPASGALIGSSLGMMVSVSVMEAEPKAQAISMALGIVAAVVAACLAALVSSTPWVAGALLCVVVFMSVVGRALGPRATAVGMLAFMGYFFALFVVARPAQIPLFASSIATGGAAAFVVRFLVVRESMERVHASVLDAFRARVQLLLDSLADELEAGEASERRLQRIRRQTGLVNEAALALEEAAGRRADEPPADAARPWLLQLLDAEVAVDMLADATHRIAGREWVAGRRQALADTMRALQRWIADGSPDARQDVERLLAETTARDESGIAHSAATLDRRERVWTRVQQAVALLLTATPWGAFPPLPESPPRVSAMSFRGGGGGIAGMQGVWPNLRLGLQATIAVALAIFAGRAISEQRWYWAVLAAFVVFIRATTFAETLSRAWQRVFGTVLGVTLGTLLAALLRRHGTVEIVVALLAMLIGYALLRVSYGGMILFITIALALLYEMMGQPVPGLMELRLAETAAGSFIGVAVAAVVFPMHSGMRVRRLVADVLREVAGVIRATVRNDDTMRGEAASSVAVGAEAVRTNAMSRDTTSGDPRSGDSTSGDPTTGDVTSDDAALHDRIRSVDRALAEVRNAVRPLWAPQVPWESRRLSRLTRAAATLAYTTRRLRTERVSMSSPEATEIEHIGAAIAANCDAVADALVAPRVPVLRPADAMIAALAGDVSTDDRAMQATLRLLRDVDALVRRLADEATHAPTRDASAPFDRMRERVRPTPPVAR